jgi:transcriptional regulator with XRE-family HTH domain
MSPFSHVLHDLRMRHEIRQVELAELLGYEQSYISALEVGLKGPPTPEFIEKLIAALELLPHEQRELRDAARASERRLVLSPDAPRDVYWLLTDLRAQIDELHPVQIKMIRDALELKGQLVRRDPEPVRRLKRRRREEVTT